MGVVYVPGALQEKLEPMHFTRKEGELFSKAGMGLGTRLAKGHELIQQLLHRPIGSRILSLSVYYYTLDGG